jgi:hypothetical protein
LRTDSSAKFGRDWLGAVCALLLVGSIFPGRVFAQSVTSDHVSPVGKKTDVSKAAPAKAQTSSAANGASARRVSSAKRVSGATHSSTPGHASAPTRAKSSRSSSSASLRSSKYSVSRKRSGKKLTRGQQKIEPERAEAIQQALIREHYLSGDPAGTWNQETEDAMRRYQADHGWQSKEVPDSRALISLGLGPSNDHLLNPESAMTTGPTISHAAAPTSMAQPDPVSHGPEPGASESGSTKSTSPALQGDPALPTSSDHDAPGPQ